MLLQSDPVKTYLEGQGIEVSIAYFLNSGFELGYLFKADNFYCIFRVEGATLLIQELVIHKLAMGIREGGQSFINWTKEIYKNVEEVKYIEWCYFEFLKDDTQKKNKKILNFFLKKGVAAQCEGNDKIIKVSF